ncbi:MAG TPA: DUF5681 domain-containing protein [Xanthobacteraceae bacterium]|jgi:hypothetical protein
MPFQKGESGNPAGRPRGSRNRASVLVSELLEGELEELVRKAIDMAKNGDAVALRLCLDRIAPARKYDSGSCELPALKTAADSVEAMARIAEAVGTGELTPSEAASLGKVVENYVQALEAREFEERLIELEQHDVRMARRANGLDSSTQPGDA